MPHFDLQAILRGDAHPLSEALATTAAVETTTIDTLRQQLATRIYRQLTGSPQLDNELLPLFTALEAPLITQIAQNDDFYSDANHPLRRTLETLIPAASHWFARDAKPSQQFYAKLDALLQPLVTHWQTNSSPDEALGDFSQWLASEDKRAALLESRLCDTERGNQKLIAAQMRVARLINNHLAQRPLPLELHTSIALGLKSELQYWVFNSTEAELAALPLWAHWQRILPPLGQLFSHGDIQVEDQQLYSQIPALLIELERSLAHTTSNPHSYQQLVDQLSHSLMAAVQKQPQEVALFPALPLPDGQLNANTKVPLALLQATEHLQVGDWILMRGDNQDAIRCKLVLKDPALDQLLFVDHTGRKVMSKTTKDVALCLSTGIAQPLHLLSLNEVITQQLSAFIERANRCQQQQLLAQKQKAEALVRAFLAEQQAQTEAAERARLAQQARVQAELDARQAAAHKAMAEARQLADEQRRRAAEQAAEQARLAREQQAAQAAEAQKRAQTAAATANALQVGAWLEINSTLPTESSPTALSVIRAKLSVIIGATGKYIFADQVGRKVAEYTREQLIQGLINGELTLLRNGDNFEEQLAKVIRGLRRDVN
ncbi:DUF1631 family protein [Cellvibrio sp. PSBB023]|uniref:DUF1631 family protein n=1 Tax=Cellvibrio sp. PSBB023 TaxID=1945512 RepID=UPI00098FBF6D|nr:DUF1631 family protein [Cellvibrio sp. PSBB023]AQT60620.1 hypothetical protein B0D95_11445 [Cellvibrio sp. PSBB023]